MSVTYFSWDVWKKYQMALDSIQDRLERITTALGQEGVPYAIIGGQAVAFWVTTKDPEAVRTTKDVDLLVRRDDLPRVRAAAHTCNMEYCQVLEVGMLVDKADPHPKRAVHLVWANEKVHQDNVLPAPEVEQSQILPPGLPVVDLVPLVAMKLQANRKHDLVHLEDMIDVGLIDRGMLAQLPAELAARLEPLLTEAGK